MPKAKQHDAQLVIRSPNELIARVDAYAQKVERDTGVKVTRANACRGLIQRGLEALQIQESREKSSS